MDYVKYKDRLYAVYKNKQDFLEHSGFGEDKLIHNAQISLGRGVEIPNLIGKFYIHDKGRKNYTVPILPILKYVQGRHVEIETPYGWLQIRDGSARLIKRESDRDYDLDFVAGFIMTGDLQSSYKAAYKKSGVNDAIIKLINILNKRDIRDKVIQFMKENGIKTIFEDNGLSLAKLAEGWANALKEEGKPKDYKEAVEFIQNFEEKKPKLDVNKQLPQVNQPQLS